MRFEQELSWYSIGLIGNLKTAPLVFPDHAPAPFRSGSWSAGWCDIRRGEDRLCLRWSGVLSAVLATSIEVYFVKCETGNRLWTVTAGKGMFPLSERGSLESSRMSTPGEITVVFECFDQQGLPYETPREEVAQRFAGLSFSLLHILELFYTADFAPTAITARPSPNNVLLTFPRCGQDLWTNEITLRQSPYFDILLSSGFSEGTNGSSEGQPDGRTLGDDHFDDSDDETAAALPKPVKSCLSPSQFPPHKTVTITEASYATYLAVVCWLQCGYIDFAPLTSSFVSPSVSREQASQLRLESIRPPATESDSSMYNAAASLSSLQPVSPKSVYRLSHLLELPSLSSLALANFTSQLTTSNVVLELFTETSACYDEISKAALDFTMKNLRAVLASQAIKDVRTRAETGELDGWESRVWAMLAMRLGEKAVELEGK
jgi:hypothetical protein